MAFPLGSASDFNGLIKSIGVPRSSSAGSQFGEHEAIIMSVSANEAKPAPQAELRYEAAAR
jgi:hypothetical protein